MQAILDELPAIREQVAREIYGDAFMDELAQYHAALLAEQESQHGSGAGDAGR